MRNKVPIIMYHWFRAPGSAPAHHSPQLEISPERFEEQMRYLKAEGYQTVSLQDLSISRTHTGDRKCVVTKLTVQHTEVALCTKLKRKFR